MTRRMLALLLVAACILQVTLALRHPLWVDEVFSLAMATGHSLEHPAAAAQPARGDFVEGEQPVNAAELRRYTEFDSRCAGPRAVVRAVFLSDISPPLYYLLLHGWGRLFGVSDLALRSMSIVFGLGCIPLVFVLGRKIGDGRTGAIAVTLFTFAPMALYYSTEGRMYSLLWFCVLWLALATMRLHERGGGAWVHLGWILASGAGLLVHYYFVFPWAAAVVFLALRRGADRWSFLALRVALVLLIIAPWYVQLPASFASWRVSQDWVTMMPAGYRLTAVLRQVLTQYFSGRGYDLWGPHRAVEAAALLVFVVLLAAAIMKDRRAAFSGVRLLPWLWFFAACLGPVAADIGRHTYVAGNGRYASAALPAACLLGGWAFARFRGGISIAALGLVLSCWLPAILATYHNRARCGEPMQDVARYVGTSGRADDLVLIHSIPTGVIGIARYATTPAGFAPWIGQLRERRVPESLATLLHGRRRVLLVKFHTVREPAPEEAWLLTHARFTPVVKFGGVSVQEFRPTDGEAF